MEEIELKQQYLREHILEKNYDPEDFADFCVQTLGRVDLEVLSLADIENIVKKYINSKAKKANQQSFIDYQLQSPLKTQSTEPPKKIINVEQIKQIFITTHPEKVIKPPINNLDELFKDPFSLVSPQISPHKHDKHNEFHTTSNQFDFILPSKNTSDNHVSNKQFQDLFNNFPIPNQIPLKPQNQGKPNMDIFNISLDQQVTEPPVTHAEKKEEPNLLKTEKKSQDEFQKPRAIKQQEIKPIEKVSEIKQKLVEKSQIEKRVKIKQTGPKIIKQQFYDIVPCNKALARTLLSDPNIEIQITGHQIVNRNFFVPDYVLYYVYTKGTGLNIEVKRKYNSFLRLRNMLAKFYPHFRLPYLEKNGWLSETDIQFIKKQKVMIQYFMNDILMNRQFRNCRIVQEFLTIKDPKSLKSKFEEYENMTNLKSIQQLCLLNGEVDVRFSDQHRIYTEKFTVYLENMEANFEKYKKLCEQLTYNYNSLLKTFSEINQIMTIIQTTTKTFNNSVEMAEFYVYENIVHKINYLYKQMGHTIKFDLKLLECQIKPMMRFQKQNFNTIRELYDMRYKMTDAFTRFTDVPKQAYTKNKKLDQYKVGIDEVSKNGTVLKYQTGFYNHIAAQESMRMFLDLSTKLNKKYMLLGNLYQQKHLELATIWKEIKNNGLK